MKLFLFLCTVALSVHSTVPSLCVNLQHVKPSDATDVSAKVFDTNGETADDSFGFQVIDRGSNAAFYTSDGSLSHLILGKDHEAIEISFEDLFSTNAICNVSLAPRAKVLPAGGKCHKPPCCKTVISFWEDHETNTWNVAAKTTDLSKQKLKCDSVYPGVKHWCNYGVSETKPSSPYWGYSGATGPEHWGSTDGYSVCGLHQQSPIDLTNTILKSFPALNLVGYSQMPKTITILNNGHNVAWRFNGLTSTPIVSGGGLPGSYKFNHNHLHWGSDSSKGSEHTVDGVSYPMEMHMVHYKAEYDNITEAIQSGDSDALAVLGFFFKLSDTDNPAFTKVVAALPYVHAADSEFTLAGKFSIQSTMVGDSDFYTYRGSLTTPTCNQIVVWTVMKEAIPISEDQLAAFRELDDKHDHKLVNNFRPVQPLNGRVIYSNM